MSEVVRDHAPTLIERHGGKETMLLLDTDLVKPMLSAFSFSTRASLSDGEFVLHQPELGLVATGETFDAAAQELEGLAAEYGAQFFERCDFYRQTDRAHHLAYLLRLALAEPEERRALLIPRPEASPEALADGRVLQTHVSHSTGKRPSPGAFSLILHEQLEVSREAFLGALRSGKPVDRPVPVEEDDAVEHEAWVVQVLANTLHMSAEEIQELGAEEAKRRVIEYWSTEKE